MQQSTVNFCERSKVSKSGGRSPRRIDRQTGAPAIRRNSAGTISKRERVPRGFSVNILAVRSLGCCFFIKFYIRVLRRCVSCVMGMMGIFKWLRKDVTHRDRNRCSLSPEQLGLNSLNNESYRNALHAFVERRRHGSDPNSPVSLSSPDKKRAEFLQKNNNNNSSNNNAANKLRDVNEFLGVPQVPAHEIFEIGCVAGTEDRYIELISAEWQNTRVSLKRYTHPDCRDAIKADINVLTEIRHPNVLLLMAVTQTDDHSLVSIFEAVDYTLYNYIHEQGERISVHGVAKCVGRLADALKHAHMRGFVHGAISSHCIYLTSNGNVKLGGWELAENINNANKKSEGSYQERLRAEIFKWQPPEVLHGRPPTTASDVYGLALLIWEMCTMHVPWEGFSRAEVERQYLHWEQGVITDLYNFPKLLNNLLEAGLQLDVTKRTLDMHKMRRFLQTLEMQYENEEPFYIDQYTNNNNQIVKTFNGPVTISPRIKSPAMARCSSAETPKNPSRKFYIHEKTQNSRVIRSISKREKYSERSCLAIRKSTEQLRKNANLLYEIERNANDINENVHVPQIDADGLNGVDALPKKFRNMRVDDYKKHEESESPSVASTSTRTIDSTDDEYPCDPRTNVRKLKETTVNKSDCTDDDYCNDTRTRIKKLKELIANKRENFFYGSDLSYNSTQDISPEVKKTILIQVKGKEYEPHKPASHKTSFEPKLNKSLGQYDTYYIKPASHLNQRSPYAYVSPEIKNAVVQPQVLNRNFESFFESSLWKKEKEICLSKMRKDGQEDIPSNPEILGGADSPRNNETYTINRGKELNHVTRTINRQPKELSDGEFQFVDHHSKSIKALKEALDRATNIIRPPTPNTESNESSPLKSLNAFECTDNTSENEALFEHFYREKLNNDSPERDIKSIERSATGENSFFDCSDNVSKVATVVSQKSADKTMENPTDVSSNAIHPRTNFCCESIAEHSHEQDSGTSTENRGDESQKKAETSQNQSMVQESAVDTNTFKVVPRNKVELEKIESDGSILLLNEKIRDKSCNSCTHKSVLARRRSLPAALGQFKVFNSSLIGKLPIRRAEVPDNTVEDLYIDDEFGDSLNVNMVLLDEDEPLDEEDFLPELLDTGIYGQM